jgi:transposase
MELKLLQILPRWTIMTYNFKRFDRGQMLLLPPDMRDWLSDDHLVWFIQDVVSQLDLTSFYESYNAKGEGRAAYHPDMMTALYFYSYCTGIRSSRKIEQLCQENVSFRVISCDQQPDHSTISRFRKKFENELAGLFIQVLTFCYEAGLCNIKTVSVDGTKIKANASMLSNRTESGLEKEIRKYFQESDEVDARELYGPDNRGDELPPELANREIRLRKLREFKERLAKEKQQKVNEQQAKIDESRNYEKSTGKKKRGRKPKDAKKVEEEASKSLKVNITDPDSRIMKTSKGYVQGFNSQAVVSEDQIIIVSEVTQECNDLNQFIPMLEATKENLKAISGDLEIGTFLGDAGYFSKKNLESITPDDPDVLVAVSKEWKTRKAQRDGKVIPLPLTPTTTMEYRLLTKEGRKLYKKRGATVEPVFGQIKSVSGFDSFMRRGLKACACEWKMICIAHNLLKLWRYGIDKVHKKINQATAIKIKSGQRVNAVAA